MSMPKLAVYLAAAVMVAACAVPTQHSQQPASYGIGRAATPQEIRGWDIDVRADGMGLPAGSGTVAAGEKIFDTKCAACHGAKGAGGPAPRLTGGLGSLTSNRPVLTVNSYWPYATTIYDYVNRSMPWDKPLSLMPDEVYAVTAYLLNVDGIVPANAVLDARTLPQVRMPNREGFVPAAGASDVRVRRCMSDCS